MYKGQESQAKAYGPPRHPSWRQTGQSLSPTLEGKLMLREMSSLQANGTAEAEMLPGPRGAGFRGSILCTRQQGRVKVRDEATFRVREGKRLSVTVSCRSAGKMG